MIFSNMDRIVFAGDSITDAGSVNPVGEGLFDNAGRGLFEDMTDDAENYFMYKRVLDGEELIVVCNYEKESEIKLPCGCVRVLGNYPEHDDSVFAPYEAAIYKVKEQS